MLLGELRRELRHHVLGHPLVGLVLEVEHRAVTRAVADGAEERRDRARLVAGDFPHGCVDRERLAGQLEVSAGDGRDQRDLVAVGERGLGVRVALVDRVEQARRLVAELERRPDVGDAGAVGELELARTGARALAETGEESDAHVHGPQPIRGRKGCLPRPCHVTYGSCRSPPHPGRT